MRSHCLHGKMIVQNKSPLEKKVPIFLMEQCPKIFREAVIRSHAFGQRRGKSGHQRAGFLVKTGGACINASSRRVPQKTNRLFGEVRVKRWGKSPPPFEQSDGHGKPNPMQDEIGNRAARLWFRVRRTPLARGFDHWSNR